MNSATKRGSRRSLHGRQKTGVDVSKEQVERSLVLLMEATVAWLLLRVTWRKARIRNRPNASRPRGRRHPPDDALILRRRTKESRMRSDEVCARVNTSPDIMFSSPRDKQKSASSDTSNAQDVRILEDGVASEIFTFQPTAPCTHPWQF